MTRQPHTIPMETLCWSRDVRDLLDRVEIRRRDPRTHEPAETVDPLRGTLERLAGQLSRAIDDLWDAAQAMERERRREPVEVRDAA